MRPLQRYLALADAHVGHELLRGINQPLHDQPLLDAICEFSADFRPHHLILLGDMLDCGVLSHWRKDKVRQVEGLRLQAEADILRTGLLEPLRATQPRRSKAVYHVGNHEQWLEDYVDQNPAIEGLIDIDKLLGLTQTGWDLVPFGGSSQVGKLHFLHGNQLSGGLHIAKKTLDTYQRNVHFGHFHTHQVYTSTTPLDTEPKQAVALPGLCRRNPGYAREGPNRWVQGFEYGWVEPDSGTFYSSVSLVVDGGFTANGIYYRIGKGR